MKSMTYSELKEQIQGHLDLYGRIKDKSEQEEVAKKACFGAVENSPYKDMLELKKDDTEKGHYYEIYTTSVAQSFKIGYFGPDDKKDPKKILVHLDKVEEYGRQEFTMARLSLVKDFFSDK